MYNDKFINVDDGYRHSKWLNFMEKRLKLSRQLLKEDGIIMISIDDNEYAQLKILCDKIF
jgi:adenine-specific DNA-methyltransferase